MAIDTSMYGTMPSPQVDAPNPMALAESGMRLSQLGMQNQALQMQRQQQQIGLAKNQAMMDAYSKNTDPSTGQVDRAGVLSDLGKNPYTAQMVPDVADRFSAQDKAQAEAQSAKLKASSDAYNIVGPYFDHMEQIKQDNPDQMPQVWAATVQQMKQQGVDTTPFNHPYDAQSFDQYYGNWQNNKQNLENQQTRAKTAEALSNVAQGPAKLGTELYGSRSPNAELTSQYDKQVQPVRNSQMAMSQMIDNYKNPSPQGDASLLLNAFKIKFPTAPDVNSLEELSKSQAAPDKFKQMANAAISGGLDQSTRDNLMRDATSTFHANYQSLQGTQQRFQARAKAQNVNDPTMTVEPAIDKTYSDAMALQNKIGPYVPPSERGGITGAISDLASRVLGTSPNKANASTKGSPSMPKPGDVEDGFVFNGGDASNPNNWKKAH